MKFKKTGIIPLLIVIILIFGTVAVYASNQVSYEKNGVIFEYPDDWQEAQSISDGSVAAIADPNNSEISILIQQVPSEYGTDLENAYATNNKQFTKLPVYINLQEQRTTINDRTAIIHRYISTGVNGTQKEHIATWMKMNDNKLYVILFSVPEEYYEQERSAYDTVVSSFELSAYSNNSFIDQIFHFFK